MSDYIRAANPLIGLMAEASRHLILRARGQIYEQTPLCSIVKLKVHFGRGGKAEGSGILYRNRKILTAAHNLHGAAPAIRALGVKWADRIDIVRFNLARRKWEMVSGHTYRPDVDYFVSPRYDPFRNTGVGRMPNDYAVINLKGSGYADVNLNEMPFWKASDISGVLNDEPGFEHIDYRLHVIGFPSYAVDKTANHNRLHAGAFENVNALNARPSPSIRGEKLLMHGGGSVKGFSGGGVFVEWFPNDPQKRLFRALGVHLGVFDGKTVARLIDRDVWKFVKDPKSANGARISNALR